MVGANPCAGFLHFHQDLAVYSTFLAKIKALRRYKSATQVSQSRHPAIAVNTGGTLA
jgi:hypothetical protein